MAKESNVVVEWSSVLEKSAELSGVPKKQLEVDADAIANGIKLFLTDKQPKRDNDSLSIKTPFGVYESIRLPETVVTDVSGNRVTRPTCCTVNIGIETTYIDAANIGLVDKQVAEKPVKAAKSA